MPRLCSLLLVLVALTAPAAALAQKRGKAKTDTRLGQNITELSFAGIPLLQKAASPDKVVAINLMLMGGLRMVPEGKEGIEALLLEALISGSSQDLPAEDIQRQLNAMGTRVAVYAGPEFSYVSLQCLEKHFTQSWALLVQQLLSPAWLEDEFEDTRARLRIQAQNLPQAERFRRNALAASLPGQLYGRQASGTDATLEKLTLDEVKAHYAGLFRLGRIRFVVVGGVAPLRLQNALIGTLSSLPKTSPDDAEQVLGELDRTHQPTLVQIPRQTTTYLQALLPAPPPGTRDAAALEVALAILSDRMGEDLCLRRNLACETFTAYAPTQRSYALVGVTSERPAATARALAQLMQSVSQQGFTQAELDARKNALITRYYAGLQNSVGQAALLAEGYARPGNDWQALLRLPPLVQSLTLEEVNAAARYLVPAQWSWYVEGDTRTITPAVFGQ